jgi:hypothetical protein
MHEIFAKNCTAHTVVRVHFPKMRLLEVTSKNCKTASVTLAVFQKRGLFSVGFSGTSKAVQDLGSFYRIQMFICICAE